MNDRNIFRTPYFINGKFAGYSYRRFVNGRVEWIKDDWEPWVKKSDSLTPGADEQCTGLRDKNGNLIYGGALLCCKYISPSGLESVFDGNVEFSTYTGGWIIKCLDKKVYGPLYDDRLTLKIIGTVHTQGDGE